MGVRNRFGAAVLLAAFGLLLGAAPAFASGGEMPSLVRDIGVTLLLAGVLAVICVRLNIPSIAAFLTAGVIAGPLVLAQVTDPANIDTIAQLGFIFLLFMIGLELDVKKILASGKPIILTGLLQFPLSILFVVAAIKGLAFFGIGAEIIGDHPYSALYIGIVLSMSSTLLVVKLFQENFELDTEPGRIALGLLIFQDIWAIIVILVQPNFENPQIVPILMSFVGIGVILLITVGLSRSVAAVGFKWIAKVPELTIVAAVSWCFIVIFLGMNLDAITEGVFGFDLHMNVGSGMAALIAGATIASLPYSTEIVTKVGNIKDFFITLFFVGLGMGIPAPETWAVPIFAFGLAFLAILTRQLVFFPLLYATGSDQRNSQVSSARLAQISEFGLVIAFLAVQHHHISPSLSSAIIFAFVLTALLTPALYSNAYRIHEKINPLLTRIGFKPPPEREAADEEIYELALLGFHRVASSLLHDLERSKPDMLKKTLVVDFNVNIHGKIAERGVTVKYGDLSNQETLHHAGIERAKIIVCTIPDDLLRGVTNAKLVRTVRHINPQATIIANAVGLKDTQAIYDAGADYVYLGRTEIANGIMEIIAKSVAGNLQEYRAAQQTSVAQRREVFD
jgi:Kef-type K+ transport system membrane component KefB/Trk K+ transport system NAD-binding subunit